MKDSVKKYYYLTKPGIIYSNVMTAIAGYLYASEWHFDWLVFASLVAGNALIIASACVFNNYIDRGIDSKMQRTKKRSIASGEITAVSALTYATILGTIGFAVLTFTNNLTFIIGLIAFVFYVIVYGYAKRRTIHGTLVGTVPGAASLVAGYTAVTNQMDAVALLLFILMLTWQMAHFYSIAIFRKKDYTEAKIPVMPVVYGNKITKLQIIIYIFAFVIAVVLFSYLGYAGLSFLVVMSAIGLYWLYKGVSGFNVKSDEKWARGMFGFSLIVLLVLSLMLSINAFRF